MSRKVISLAPKKKKKLLKMTRTRASFNTPYYSLFVSVQQAAHTPTALFQLEKRAKSCFPFSDADSSFHRQLLYHQFNHQTSPKIDVLKITRHMF